MIFVISSVILIVTLAQALYWLYLRPKKLCDDYAKLFKSKGYRVLQFPFQPFSSPIQKYLIQDQQQHKDYGYSTKRIFSEVDFVISNILFYPQVININWDFVKKIYSNENSNFLPKNLLGLYLIKSLTPQSIVFLQGDLWKNKRKHITKVMSFEFLKVQIPLIVQICNQNFNAIELGDRVDEENGEEWIEAELQKMGIELFSSVVISGFLGMEAVAEKLEGEAFQQYLYRFIQSAGRMSKAQSLVLLFGDTFVKLGIKQKYRAFNRKKQIIEQFLSKIINKIQQNYKLKSPQAKHMPKTIIDSLLLIREEEGDPNMYNTADLSAEIKTFIMAGSDTTTNFFTQMLFQIFQHSEVHRKLMEDINQVIKVDSDITYENLKKLHYIDWVQHQTTRMCSVFERLFDRVITKDITINDVTFKKGTILNTFIKSVFYNSEYFPKPFSFKPERWNNPVNSEIVSMVTLGFGFGPRSCVGRQLALLESKIALIMFLRRYDKLKEMDQRKIVFGLACKPESSRVRLRKYNKSK